jgi:heat shock protein beta
VDSDDFPLNVSRETLQHNALLRVIRKKLLQKALEMIKNLMDNEEEYLTFYKEYSNAIKMGLLEDTKNSEKLVKFLRYYSSKSKKLISLDEYIKNMKKGQEQIFYITGESVKQLDSSPFVENLVSKGYEILVGFIFLVHFIGFVTHGKRKVHDGSF